MLNSEEWSYLGLFDVVMVELVWDCLEEVVFFCGVFEFWYGCEQGQLSV